MARAALGAAALLIHATLLPLLHADHRATLDLERALALAAAPASGAAALAASDATPAHDRASCPVCATFGRAGAAIAPAALVTGVVPIVAGKLPPLPSAGRTAPDLTRHAPRGPPAFVS